MPHHPPLPIAMIGGGQDAFIGAVHRLAFQLDNTFTLAAGAFSSTPERSKASGHALGLPHNRTYDSWQQLLQREITLPPDQRAAAVCIVTPNYTHHQIAKAALLAGFPVICDKPLTITLKDAEDLAKTVNDTGIPFAVTYNYTGYPMVRHAAHLVRTGTIGTLRKAFVEYHQGWLATHLEATGQKQAAWRNDPAQAGAAGAIGDIGSHAENLLATVTGLHPQSVAADLTPFVPGRTLDDDASVLIRYPTGAKATLTVSQVCIGEQNNLTLRLHGDQGSLWWSQEQPNHLTLATLSGPTTTIHRGTTTDSPAHPASRLPPGHPEGFIEAFANIYKDFAHTLHRWRDGKALPQPTYPTVHDGLRSIKFIHAALQSSHHKSAWTTLP